MFSALQEIEILGTELSGDNVIEITSIQATFPLNYLTKQLFS